MIIGGQTCSNCGRPSHCGTKLQNTQSFGLNKIPTDKFLVICDSCRCIHCHGVECVSCGTITLDYVKIMPMILITIYTNAPSAMRIIK